MPAVPDPGAFLKKFIDNGSCQCFMLRRACEEKSSTGNVLALGEHWKLSEVSQGAHLSKAQSLYRGRRGTGGTGLDLTRLFRPQRHSGEWIEKRPVCPGKERTVRENQGCTGLNRKIDRRTAFEISGSMHRKQSAFGNTPNTGVYWHEYWYET